MIRLKSGAASAAMCLPVPVSPVNATRRISGWVTSASPITEPRPVTTLSTPAGSPASWKSSATFSVASGVDDAGLTTTVLPAASAGPIFVPISVSGKLYGTIAATGPTGRLTTIPYERPSVDGRSWYAPRTFVARSA